MNFKNIILGAIIGVANIIPGVSGGTMAVILNVYDKIIFSISNLKSNFKQNFLYLLPFGIGAFVGILAFSNLIKFSLENYNMLTNMIFIGLILGSVPLVYKKATEKKANIACFIAFIISFAIMILMRVLTPLENEATLTLTVFNFFYLFFASLIASSAMIIPGISGSFVMLLLGTYTTVLTALSDLNILILIPVALGVLVGIIGSAKIIEKLFLHFKSETYFSVLGLMLGSIFVIFPVFTFNIQGVVSIIALVIVAFTASKLGSRR